MYLNLFEASVFLTDVTTVRLTEVTFVCLFVAPPHTRVIVTEAGDAELGYRVRRFCRDPKLRVTWSHRGARPSVYLKPRTVCHHACQNMVAVIFLQAIVVGTYCYVFPALVPVYDVFPVPLTAADYNRR